MEKPKNKTKNKQKPSSKAAKSPSGSKEKVKRNRTSQHLVRHLRKYLTLVGKLHLLASDAAPTAEEKAAIRRDFIPFYRSMSGHGTQNPTLDVPLTPLVITTTASTVNQQVYTVAPNSLQAAATITLLFDEIRFEDVRFRYDANLCGSALSNGPTALSVAVIDFDDSSVIATYNSGVSYDVKKIYSLAPASDRFFTWNGHPDFVPDQQWYDTAASTPVLYWKNFTSAAHGLGTQSLVGILSAEATVQFRQFRNV